MCGECSFNDVAGSFRQTVPVEFGLRDPTGGAHVVARHGRSFRAGADVVHEHVMIFGAAFGVAHNAFEDFEQLADGDDQARFFGDFAAERFVEAFADFDGAAWQRPPALQWLAAAFDQQDAVVAKDDGADSDDGTRRIMAIVGANTETLPSRPIVAGT